jgi:indolepyruvate ferredoxin oxidoreductase
LLAYKDEYEVARLHLDGAERARRDSEFGPDAKVRYHLHPPFLRALGMKRKLKLGGWFSSALRVLSAGRRLRGTPFDPFGHAAVRRTERALIGEYEEHVRVALERFTPSTQATAVELCESADLVRGYEQIKLDSVERFRARAAELRERLPAA